MGDIKNLDPENFEDEKKKTRMKYMRLSLKNFVREKNQKFGK